MQDAREQQEKPPTRPPRNKKQGEEKTRQGEPHQPREKRKAPLDAEDKRKNTDEIAGEAPGWARWAWWSACPACIAPLGEASRQKKTEKQTVLLFLVILKETVVVTMHPHPGTPKQGRQRTFTGPKLKGQPKPNRNPKATKHYKFLEQDSRPLTREQTQKQHSFEKNTAGWRAHGPARFSGESLPATLVPRSRSSPTKGTAPGSAIAVKMRRLSLDPRECSATSPPLKQTTRGTPCRQDRTITHYHTLSQTRSASSQTTFWTRKCARGVTSGRRGQTPTAHIPQNSPHRHLWRCRRCSGLNVYSTGRASGGGGPDWDIQPMLWIGDTR